jgi:hypothetical protein
MNEVPTVKHGTQDLADAVLRQLIALVEPLTRFDRSSLSIAASATDRIAVSARERFAVVFDWDNVDAAGRLTNDVVGVANASGLSTHLDRVGKAARDALPARMHKWLQLQTALPGKSLSKPGSVHIWFVARQRHANRGRKSQVLGALALELLRR